MGQVNDPTETHAAATTTQQLAGLGPPRGSPILAFAALPVETRSAG